VRYGLCVGVLTICLGLYLDARVAAHPMPNSVIAISLSDDGARFDVAIPLPELRLALPESIVKTSDLLVEPQRSAMVAYFKAHCFVQSKGGATEPLVIESMTLGNATDENVGQYQELRVQMFVAASAGFDPRRFTLTYDVVIHQVPNHFALVQIVRDFRAGVLVGDRATDVGVIRFDFVRNETPSVSVTAAPASLWRGLGSAVALGFHHVATGFDHVLFLITLLIVAPLRAVDGQWSLFQGWGYATRRFLAISLAFTLGHSAALLVGTYQLVPVRREVVEVLIAASILIAAVHAIRPLFSGREWFVAAAFGTVHGLAFSESLAGLALMSWVRALAVAGFNIGVEGAQLVAMAFAVPFLVASRWQSFHAIRVSTMICAGLLAGFWMLERGWLPPFA